jgi:hypothetical protein
METAMTDQDPNFRCPTREPTEQYQPDPMLRRTAVPWGWGIVVVAALIILAVLVFGTNQNTGKIASGPPANPPVTTGSGGPAPPATTPNAGRGTANAPPAPPPSTTGSAK